MSLHLIVKDSMDGEDQILRGILSQTRGCIAESTLAETSGAKRFCKKLLTRGMEAARLQVGMEKRRQVSWLVSGKCRAGNSCKLEFNPMLDW